jgi:hypothetical protein
MKHILFITINLQVLTGKLPLVTNELIHDF